MNSGKSANPFTPGLGVASTAVHTSEAVPLGSGVSTPCVLWNGSLARSGVYGSRRVNGRNVQAHRLTWEQANGPIPHGLYVCHRCDNPPCVNLDHLFLGTIVENIHDATLKGKYRGQKNGRAKLTERDVRDIREAWKAGVNGVALSEAYAVSNPVIYRIVHRKTWKHI